MGNTKSQKLKESFLKGKYSVKESRKDQLLGMYTVIQFAGSDSGLYIQKVLNPAEYDEYADINEFIKKLSNSCKNICEFHFVEFSSTNQDIFDLVFEFGNLLKFPLAKEKYFWLMIEQITDAMMFLEESILHYPFLHKNYIVQVGPKNFKLINPYCFPDYLKEVLQVYMNPMNPVTKRKNYSQTQIKRNIREFGVMLITMIQSHSVQRLLREPNYWQEAFTGLRGKVSKELESFIAYILQTNANSPNSFMDIRTWLNSFKPKFDKRKLNIFASLLETPKKQQKAQSLQLSKVESEDISNAPIQYTDFSPNINQVERFEPARMQEPNPLSNFYKEDLNYMMNNNSSVMLNQSQPPRPNLYNPVDNRFFNESTPVKHFLKGPLIDHNHRPKNFEFINHTPVNGKDMTSYFQNHNFTPGRLSMNNGTNENHRLDTQKVMSLKEFPAYHEPIGSNRLSRSNLPDVQNNQGQMFMNDMQMANDQKMNNMQANVPNNNMMQNQVPKQQASLFNSVSLPQLPIQVPIQVPIQNLNQTPPAILKSANNTQVPELPKNVPVIQPKANEIPNPDRQVQRVLIKWLREENRYQKTIEYSDNTSEVVNMNDEENKQYETYSPKLPDKPVPQPINTIDEKKSYMGNYDIQNSMVKLNNNQGLPVVGGSQATIALFRSPSEAPLLLFRIPLRPDAGIFRGMSNVVDQSNPLKPSMYHQLENEGNIVIDSNPRLSKSFANAYSPNTQPVNTQQQPQFTFLNNNAPVEVYSVNTQPRMMVQTKFVS